MTLCRDYEDLINICRKDQFSSILVKLYIITAQSSLIDAVNIAFTASEYFKCIPP